MHCDVRCLLLLLVLVLLLIVLLAIPPPPPARWNFITRTPQNLQSLFTSLRPGIPASKSPGRDRKRRTDVPPSASLLAAGPSDHEYCAPVPRTISILQFADFHEGAGTGPWDVMMVTRRDSQLVCGRSVPSQCNIHAYSNPETPYSPWPNVDSSRDLWMLHRICEG